MLAKELLQDANTASKSHIKTRRAVVECKRDTTQWANNHLNPRRRHGRRGTGYNVEEPDSFEPGPQELPRPTIKLCSIVKLTFDARPGGADWGLGE